MVAHLFAATHSTAPWYFIIPAVALLGVRLFYRARRGRTGMGGPSGRGPFGGGNNP